MMHARLAFFSLCVAMSSHAIANLPPVIDPVPSQTVAEGETLTKAISASDPDGGVVTIIATGLQNSWMSFDGANLTLTPGHDQAGNYEVTVVASDGVSRSKATLGITVSNTNRAPELSALGEWHVGVGHALSFPVTASDADNDTLRVSASGLQYWMSFDGKSFRAYPPLGNVGSYMVTITASDDQASVSLPVTIHVTEEGQAFPPPWTAYVGSQWTGTVWSGTERSWLGYLTGINLVNSPGKIGDLVEEVGNRIVNHDVIVTIEGFGGDSDATTSSEIAPVIDLMYSGGLATWQESVIMQVEALSPLDLEARRIYYQLGNEITKQKNSDTIRAWAATRGIVIPGASRDNDHEMIPYYVEYYLAPTLEAMAIASERAYGDPDKVNITLGSIGNGGTTDARAYLDALLNYRVQGQYAPSLAGKQVYELVDLLTVHYPGATSNLDPIIDQWMGRGAVRGLWTTEVIGIKDAAAGKGAGTAAWELNNYLMWTYERGLTSEQVRYSLYGWEISGSASNTAADRFMQDFLGFFGNVALEARRNDVQLTGDASLLQATLFIPLADQTSRAVTVTTSSQLAQNALLSGLTVDKSDWTGEVVAMVNQYTPSGLQVSTARVVEGNDHYSITLSPSITLTGGGDAVMVTLKRK